MYCLNTAALHGAWKGHVKVLEEHIASARDANMLIYTNEHVSEHTVLLELVAYHDVITSWYHS